MERGSRSTGGAALEVPDSNPSTANFFEIVRAL
jgi:hypothetical protein